MKSPELSSQEKKNDSPISHVKSNPLVDQLKKDLKFSYWDFQAKNGTKASVVNFANSPSFKAILNTAKQSGLSMEEMGAAVDYIRDVVGKKYVLYKDPVKISSLDQKYSVHGDAEHKNNNSGNRDSNNGSGKDSDGVADAFDTFQTNLDRIKAQSDARHQSETVENGLFLKNTQTNLDRIASEADVRNKEERGRIENERAESNRVFLEEQKMREKERLDHEADLLRNKEERGRIENERAESDRVFLEEQKMREKERLDHEADLLRSVEKKKQIESFVKNVQKEFSILVDKWFVTMRADQFDRAVPFNSKNYSIERRALYMNDVYLDVRNFAPSGDELQFSIRDNTLVCSGGRSIEGVDLASFDLKDLDDSSRVQVLIDIKNKWKTFVDNLNKQKRNS